MRNGKRDTTDKTNGDIAFRIFVEVKGDHIVFEMTHIRYSSPDNELANFEDQAILSNDGVHRMNHAQQRWSRIKNEYFTRLLVVAGTLKGYFIKHYANYIKR